MGVASGGNGVKPKREAAAMDTASMAVFIRPSAMKLMELVGATMNGWSGVAASRRRDCIYLVI